MKCLTVLIALSLAGCASVQYQANPSQSVQSGVRVLYEYPNDAKYKSLGVITAEVYQPGFRAPTTSDVMPKLTAKAASAGGNALIVRNNQVGQFDRSISVTAEVLLVEWPQPKP